MHNCVYVLYSKKLDKYYVGMTEDLDQRLYHHNHPISGSKFTAHGVPWELFLSMACESKEHALKVERLIKSKKSRIFIENLKKYPELEKEYLRKASDC